jgi:peptidoglycan/xylan/chitin deacetylase (PgdA/CDA1 family)
MPHSQLLSITFHYVGMPETPFPGIHGLTTIQFREAITGLMSDWSLVSINDIVKTLDGKGSLPEKACLISLDDGLRCQFEVALPILDDLHAPGAFFVLGTPYIKAKAAAVHQLHYIRANHGDQLLIDIIDEIVAKDSHLKCVDSVDQTTALQHYRYDSPASAKLKYYLNYKSTPEFTRQIMNTAFKRIGVNEAKFIKDYYMDRSMIKDLGSRGYLGSHAETHLPLATLSARKIKKELCNTREFLEEVSGTKITAISYPLGNTMAVSRKVGDIALETGHRIGWTMERAVNQSLDDPLLLARLDAADRDNIDNHGPRQRYLAE